MKVSVSNGECACVDVGEKRERESRRAKCTGQGEKRKEEDKKKKKGLVDYL